MAFNEYIEPIIAGNYCVRLLKDEVELRQYQDLRYRYLILGFNPEKAKTDAPGTTDDNIGYDKQTSQLCVFYNNPETGREEIVGGYMLMRFKTENDFCKATLKYDLSNLLNKHKFKILEITRAVTHPDHRNGLPIKLLWRGVKAYIEKYNLHYIIGTLSFLGTDPMRYNQAASYIYHNYLMPEDIMVTPIDKYAYYHGILPKEQVDRSLAIRQLAPLLKGYLLLGAKVCKGFIIDHDLKTVETLAILDTQKIDGKYRHLK